MHQTCGRGGGWMHQTCGRGEGGTFYASVTATCAFARWGGWMHHTCGRGEGGTTRAWGRLQHGLQPLQERVHHPRRAMGEVANASRGWDGPQKRSVAHSRCRETTESSCELCIVVWLPWRVVQTSCCCRHAGSATLRLQTQHLKPSKWLDTCMPLPSQAQQWAIWMYYLLPCCHAATF